ncbi:MAG: hypothetical protein MJ180_06335 [Candidatus Gastranaerophilales bacterium]|nr:hypothetical protein [Candidatus Gastranaerophilales bacterium]
MLAAVAQLQNFYKYSSAYLYKNNPFHMFINTILVNWTELVSQNKKLKIAKYRVNHLKYRLYQMEQIIDQGNPYNVAEGQKLDTLR